MTVWIGECPVGIFAFDENGKRIASKIFPEDVREISDKMFFVRKENPTDEHIELIKELLDEGYNKFVIESNELASELNERFNNADIEVEVPNLANEKLRSNLREIGAEFGFEDMNKLLRDVNILMTREELRREASERDKIIIESINTVDELDETINNLYGRIREWYGIHFPELERHISDYTTYFEIISELGDRKNFTKENLTELNIPEKTAKKIQKDAEDSIGAEFDELDTEAIQINIDKILGLEKARKKTSKYLEGLMEQVAPNMKTLVGHLIGARLISLAGGLDELAKMPSSTVQVLGAEKALFRSLSKGAKPPKHGVIFQYPEIRNSPQDLRGKIARALAGKLAIAARVDAMSGKFVGDELKEEVEKRIESIKKKK